MADNYVEIKIKASDTAKPDLTELRKNLDELGRKVESAKVDVDDADGKAKLLALNAKLAALDKRVSNPKITVAGAARAEADIAAIDAQLKHLGDSAAKTDGRLAGLRTRLRAVGDTAGVVAGVGAAFSMFSRDASMATRVMSGFSLATGLLEAPLAGVVVGIGGLASGLVAGGVGLAAFGAVAKANFTAVNTAANQTQAAQTAYNASVVKANWLYQQQLKTATNAKQAQAATSAHAKALLAAEAAQVKATASAYDQLSPAQIQLAKQVANAKNAWQSFVQSNTDGVAKIMTQGMGLLPKVFASMQPFMAPTEKALGGLISQLGKGLGSSGFKSFINMLATNAGPAITKLGQSIGHIAVGLGGVIRAFMPFSQIMMSGLDRITAKFAHWGSTLTSHSGFQSLVSMAKADMPLVIQIFKNLGTAVLNLGKSMTGLSTFANSKMLLQLLVPLSQFVAWLTKANPALLRIGLYALAAGGAFMKMKAALVGIKGGIEVVSALPGKLSGAFSTARMGGSMTWDFLKGLGGNLRSAAAAAADFSEKMLRAGAAAAMAGVKMAGAALKTVAMKTAQIAVAAATKIWTAAQWLLDVALNANPISLIIIAIALLVGAIVFLALKCGWFRAFWKAVWHDIAHIFDIARHGLATGFDFLVNTAKSVLGWFGRLPALFHGWWNDAVNAVKSVVGGLLGYVKGIPGRILSSLGNLGSLLFNAGKNVVQGLINGITSMIGAAGNAIGGVVSTIRSFLPFSPAKKGPLSGAGSPDKAGRKIGQMLAEGMTGSTSAVSAAAARLAGGASVNGTGRGAGMAGAGGTLKVQLEFVGGDDMLLRGLRNAIRVRGGNVQQVLGH